MINIKYIVHLVKYLSILLHVWKNGLGSRSNSVRKKKLIFYFVQALLTCMHRHTHQAHTDYRSTNNVWYSLGCTNTDCMCCTSLNRNIYEQAGEHASKILCTFVTFNSPIQSHTARTHSYTHVRVSSHIQMSYFKGFRSEHSSVWYLKQHPRVLSTHSHIHTHSYTQSLTPQQKYTDWSQCRAIER